MPFTETGNFVARDPKRVDPRLVDILRQAAAGSPYKVEAYSGYRPGDPRFHGQGIATDLRIYGPDGKAVPNYQSAQGYRTYEEFARRAREVQMQKYPELANQFRWGGYFWNGGPGHYGNADLMHFDLGGGRVGMGGGSWAGGPSKAMMAAYGLSGASPQPSVMVASNEPRATAPAGPPAASGAVTATGGAAPASGGGEVPAVAPAVVEPPSSASFLSNLFAQAAAATSGGGTPGSASGPPPLSEQPGDAPLPEMQYRTAALTPQELAPKAPLAGDPSQALANLSGLFKVKDIGGRRSSPNFVV